MVDDINNVSYQCPALMAMLKTIVSSASNLLSSSTFQGKPFPHTCPQVHAS